ncbi:hypothetical protein JCM8547_002049 [Rhodosporidiobolus lusitaniae]
MPRHDSAATKKPKGGKPLPVKKSATRKGKSSTYNAYMNAKLAAIKKDEPTLAHKEVMKKAMEAWKAEQKGKAA